MLWGAGMGVGRGAGRPGGGTNVRKICQKSACVKADLPTVNLPPLREKSLPGPSTAAAPRLTTTAVATTATAASPDATAAFPLAITAPSSPALANTAEVPFPLQLLPHTPAPSDRVRNLACIIFPRAKLRAALSAACISVLVATNLYATKAAAATALRSSTHILFSFIADLGTAPVIAMRAPPPPDLESRLGAFVAFSTPLRRRGVATRYLDEVAAFIERGGYMSFALKHFARAAGISLTAPLELAVADDGSEDALRLQSIYHHFGFIRHPQCEGDVTSYPPFLAGERKTYMRAACGIRGAV